METEGYLSESVLQHPDLKNLKNSGEAEPVKKSSKMPQAPALSSSSDLLVA